MRVLVCGSEGSLMQAVIPKLVEAGHKVSGVDNLMRYGRRFDHAKVDYEFHKLDLADNISTESIMQTVEPDYVIQAAARIYGIGGFNKYCADILGEDVSLHNNVLKSAVNCGVKRVAYISSSMVYENCVQSLEFPVTEDMPDHAQNPTTDYGLSKFVGERLSKAFARQYKLDYTIWRPFNIITPYEKAESSDIGISHVFADFIKKIIVEKSKNISIIGDGSQVRCFTWIHDVAQAIADYSFDPRTQNQCYNLGNDEPITMTELAHMIHDVGVELKLIDDGNLTFTTVRHYHDDVRIRIPNVDKAQTQLNWKAKQKVRESIEQCLKQI